jgi:hypothetical protein
MAPSPPVPASQLLLLLLEGKKSRSPPSDDVLKVPLLVSLPLLLLLSPLLLLPLLVLPWRTQPTSPHRQLLCVLQ